MAYEREYLANEKYKSLIGKVIFNDEVLDFTFEQEGRTFYRAYKVRCTKCGTERRLEYKEVSALYRASLMENRPKNFGYKLCSCNKGIRSSNRLDRYLIYVGKKIDGTKLTIKDIYIKENKIFAKYICDCGTLGDAWLPSILCKHTTSCGCKLMNTMKNNSNYSSNTFIGKMYGDLSVIDIRQTETGGIEWLCKCLLCDKTQWINPKLVVERNWHINCGCKIQSALERNAKYTHNSLIGTDQGGGIIQSIIRTPEGITRWVMNCPFCGKEYEASAANVSIGNTKSCGCIGMSFGEAIVESILKELNINYIRGASPKDLLNENGNRLRFDFAIKYGDNKFGVIEYDGEQHYNLLKHNFSRDATENMLRYSRLQINDKIKDDYCRSNNIKMLRIRASEYKNDTLKIKNLIKNYFNL